MPLPQAVIRSRSIRIQPISNGKWKKLGRDKEHCDSSRVQGACILASAVFGGKEGERKHGLECGWERLGEVKEVIQHLSKAECSFKRRLV